MPMGISLRQTVTVYPAGDSDPNNPTEGGDPFDLPCRFEDKTEVVSDKYGRDVVASARILFDKFAPVDDAAEYEYTDESGMERRYSAIKTERKRWLNGKTLITVVYVK